MTTVSVKVQPDHLELLTRAKKPLLAIAELIWNGLDADATHVTVAFRHGLIGSLSEIVVTDDGTGMCHKKAVAAFENLGGSWKRNARRSPEAGRLLHGRAGKGRFRAFSLGHCVVWSTVATCDGPVQAFTISGAVDKLGTFEISDPTAATSTETGTQVTISEIERGYSTLGKATALPQLAEEFAIYLHKYRDVVITYDGENVDPVSLEKNVAEYSLDPVTLLNGMPAAVSLEIIEWTMETDRRLYLCDAQGFALHSVPPGIQAPGFNFSAYLKSDFLRELDDSNLLDLDEMHAGLTDLIDSAQKKLREHFRERASEAARELVAQWKHDRVYPYEDEPKTQLDEAKRQVFDVVALKVHEYAPDFAAGEHKAQRLSLKLLREAIEDSPAALRKILTEVLELPVSKQNELAELLGRTSLSAIIVASKMVSDRLNFLQALELMVFDSSLKPAILERRHLHKILENETWIFGEEFNLTVSDKSLSDVLRKHLSLLGREPGADDEPVLRDDGSKGIVDLMLSRRIPQSQPEEHHHLIVELKRPTQHVDSDVLKQIKSYAFAVAKDERFADVKTNWSFWALSTQISEEVRYEASQAGRPPGQVFERDNIQIWVKTWAQVLNGAKARLHFFQQSLEYQATEETALGYLRKVYADYLPPAALERTTDQSKPA
jgi:hypothetical protein